MSERAATATPRERSNGTTGPLRIAAVIPALNEAPSIGRVVQGLRTQTATALAQVIVIDNGSNDDTATIAREAGATVVAEPRRGYGYACRAGVLAADADVIVLLDGDAADDPADLPRVLGPLPDGTADLVVGSRSLGTLEPGSMTPHQMFGNWLAATMVGSPREPRRSPSHQAAHRLSCPGSDRAASLPPRAWRSRIMALGERGGARPPVAGAEAAPL